MPTRPSLLWLAAAALVGAESAAIAVNPAQLQMIKQTAQELCLRPSQTGSVTAVEASASISGSLARLLRRLAGIQATVGVKGSRSQFTNVVQNDLHRENSNYRLCVQRLFITMFNSVQLQPRPQRIAAPPPRQVSRPQPNAVASATRPRVGATRPTATTVRPVATGCDRYTQTAEQWRARYLGETRLHSWHVFVRSLAPDQTEEAAAQMAGQLQARFPQFDFNVMPTVADPERNNYRWAIVMGEGLASRSEAMAVVAAAKACGVAGDAYPFQQTF